MKLMKWTGASDATILEVELDLGVETMSFK